jgi:hypothetical protein
MEFCQKIRVSETNNAIKVEMPVIKNNPAKL